MDSRVVNKLIRSEIWPFLRTHGWNRFTARTAWRFKNETIQVVNFQSFNSYLADGLGCTTYSFALNLGVYLSYVPSHLGSQHPKRKNGDLFPMEYECHFRQQLQKCLKQPEFPRPDIWFLDSRGGYLQPVMKDVQRVLGNDALLWFDRFSKSYVVLDLLLTTPAAQDSNDGTWGFGLNPSPIRSYLVGYAALHLGQNRLAADNLGAALQSGCFHAVAETLRNDIERAGANDNVSG